MADIWNRYECMVLFDPDLGEEARTDLIRRVKEYVTNESGRILKTNHWGLRDLAFEMKGRSKAYYLLLEFAGPARAATELDRRLNLLDTVLKFQTIKLDERVDPAELPAEEVEEVAQASSAPTSQPPVPDEEEEENEDEAEEDED
ncbi:30S ribosomal protein S6 [Deferrisoma palaeochoriense]